MHEIFLGGTLLRLQESLFYTILNIGQQTHNKQHFLYTPPSPIISSLKHLHNQPHYHKQSNSN